MSEQSVAKSQQMMKKAAGVKEAAEVAKAKAKETVKVRFENLLDSGIDVRLFYKCKYFTYDQHAIPGEVYNIPNEALNYFKGLSVVDFVEREEGVDGEMLKTMKREYRPRFAFMLP